jgi:hypothetical protein
MGSLSAEIALGVPGPWKVGVHRMHHLRLVDMGELYPDALEVQAM